MFLVLVWQTATIVILVAVPSNWKDPKHLARRLELSLVSCPEKEQPLPPVA